MVKWQQQEQEQQQEGPHPASPPEGAQVAPAAADGSADGKPPATQQKPGKAQSAGKSKLTREQRSALADKLLGGTPDEKPPDTKPAAKPEEKPAGDKPPEKPAGDAALPGATKTALGELLKSGKLLELAAQLGIEGKALDTSSAKLALVRERVTEAKKSEKAAAEAKAAAESIRADCKKEFGEPFRLRAAIDKGEFAEAAQRFETFCGMSFAEFTRQVAAHTKGMDPKALDLWKRERAIKAKEDEVAERAKQVETSKTAAERTAKATKTIEAKCSGHPALRLRGGALQIFRLLEDAFDSTTGTVGLGYKQAADKVLEAFDADALALGYAKPGATPEKKPAPPPEEKPVAGKKPFKAPDGQHQDSNGKTRKGKTFEERSALASRAFERGRLS